MPPKSNMRTLLETVSSCVEFKEIRFRQGEKGVSPDMIPTSCSLLTIIYSPSARSTR